MPSPSSFHNLCNFLMLTAEDNSPKVPRHNRRPFNWRETTINTILQLDNESLWTGNGRWVDLWRLVNYVSALDIAVRFVTSWKPLLKRWEIAEWPSAGPWLYTPTNIFFRFSGGFVCESCGFFLSFFFIFVFFVLFYLPGTSSGMLFVADAVKMLRHRILGYGGYSCKSRLEPKKKSRESCNTSSADSTALGTAEIPASLSSLKLGSVEILALLSSLRLGSVENFASLSILRQ